MTQAIRPAVRGRLSYAMRPDIPGHANPNAAFSVVETRNGMPVHRPYVYWSKRPAEDPQRWALVLAAATLARTIAGLAVAGKCGETWEDEAA